MSLVRSSWHDEHFQVLSAKRQMTTKPICARQNLMGSYFGCPRVYSRAAGIYATFVQHNINRLRRPAHSQPREDGVYRARCSFCPWSSARRSHIYKQNIFPDIPHVYIYDRSAWRARALAQSAGHRRRTSAGCFAKEIRPRPNHAKTKLFESRSVMNPVQNVKLDSWACKVVQGMTRYRASWIGLCIYIYIYICIRTSANSI
jgi:hypothetical protein